MLARSIRDLRLVKDNIAAEIAKLKAQPGKNLALAGGAGIAQTFILFGLVDDYQFQVHPVINLQTSPSSPPQHARNWRR